LLNTIRTKLRAVSEFKPAEAGELPPSTGSTFTYTTNTTMNYTNQKNITPAHSRKNSSNPLCRPNCNQGTHTNPYCQCNTTREDRAGFLEDYLAKITPVTSDIRLMPLDSEGKTPIYAGDCKLISPEAQSYLKSGDEAIASIRQNNARGFALYAGNSSFGTEDLVFTDHDDTDLFPLDRIPNSLTVMSGSGRGYHRTYVNAGSVQNSIGKGDLEGAGEIRARNWYVILPGSIHPSGGIYHIVQDSKVTKLAECDLPRELQPGSLVNNGSTEPRKIPCDEINNLPERFEPNEITNDVGVPLADVRTISKKLTTLMTKLCPSDYPSASEADMSTVSLLLYWRFDETDIANILRATRSRAKINREDYISMTIKNTSHTEISPCDSKLLKSLIKSAKENNGRPQASSLTLMEVRDTLLYLNGKATVCEIAEVEQISSSDIKVESLKRRIRRALKILDDAGYVSSKPDGRTNVWENKGLEELYLPDDYTNHCASSTSSPPCV